MTVLDAVIGPNWGGTFRDSVVGRLADRIQAEAVPVEGVGSDSVSDRQADEQRVYVIGVLRSIRPNGIRLGPMRGIKLIGKGERVAARPAMWDGATLFGCW